MAKQPAKAAFEWMDPLGTLYGRRLRKTEEVSAGGHGASSASLLPFMGSLADVIQLPDMDFSTCRGGGQKRTPSLLSRVREGVERKTIDFSGFFFSESQAPFACDS